MAIPEILITERSPWTIPAARLKPSELAQMTPLTVVRNAIKDGLETALVREGSFPGTYKAWEKIHLEYNNPKVRPLLREGAQLRAMLDALDLLVGGDVGQRLEAVIEPGQQKIIGRP